MCVYVGLCVYTLYVCAYMYACMHVYMCICMCVYVCVYVCIYVYMHSCIFVSSSSSSSSTAIIINSHGLSARRSPMPVSSTSSNFLCPTPSVYICVCMHNTCICFGGKVQWENVRRNCPGVNCPEGNCPG